jgi:hypothetical protein
MTGRSIFTEDYHHYIVEPYTESRMRFDIASRLISGETVSGPEGDYLSSLKRPIFIVSYMSQDRTPLDRMERLYGLPVFQQGEVSVYMWTLNTVSSLPTRGK